MMGRLMVFTEVDENGEFAFRFCSRALKVLGWLRMT